ncbi:eukaryotic translation initiation factor 3 subunit A-like [Amphibalanus amphitrite]|uniref:eukaryotic translation initiation factor 3 subunit A-like n=1 Tax=Amphibalanus amphitrite TaxID=1232801 RepID=UPI001C92346A|nr:eukaryotic translation initiation factor 3 subunit A-like [Amphibalanus amphitrite]XP_043233841.1 eukaryotic translation initiation factor 3 subunit A-like [Amphibalanus amphitrite]XP_043233842.1 eukaryotic translation initiation factor 3 subunit A-like [Amphibalanus amphitrite]
MADPDGGEFELEEAPPKPPDKNKVEKSKHDLSCQIDNLEKQLKGCNLNEGVDERLQQLRTAREALYEQHRLTDERLKSLARLITETRQAITKLRDKLKYRTEKQVDDAVQRLETQIHTHNFRLREEEKIVREINELKKSKRTIRDYDSKKRELETLNQKQRSLRYERDRFFSEIDKNQREEDRILRERQSAEANIKMLNEELADLRRQRQAADESYRQQVEQWQRWQRAAADRRRKAREDTGRPPPPPPAPPPAAAPAGTELRAPPEPYRAELAACEQLLAYLQRLAHTPNATPATPSALLTPSGAATPLSPRTPVSPRTPQPPSEPDRPLTDVDGDKPMFVLRRREEETPQPPPSRPKRRRDRRGSQRVRPLTHTADVFHQFCLLGLQPPCTSKEAPAALEQVKAKQKYFQMCALKARQERADRTEPRRPERAAGTGAQGAAGGPPLTLRLNSSPLSEPPPPPPPDGMVTLHSIGVQLPYQLTMAAPASATPSLAYLAQASVDSSCSCPADAASRPLSRDSGVPSAPLSAEAAEPGRDPFAEALQSRLAAGDGANPAAPRTETLEVPCASQESGIGSA